MSKISDKNAIEITKDGDQTVFNTHFDRHYHSVHGAIKESEHVFIAPGLKESIADPVRVLEIGLGTCLNALLTLRETIGQRSVYYHGLELHPLPPEIHKSLAYLKDDFPEVNSYLGAMHELPWDDQYHAIRADFQLRKTEIGLKEWIADESYDLIYFDAFGPGCQPELWTPDVFERLYQCTNPGGILTTYSCKGDVRRGMMAAGYKVEKLPGPPAKRSMLRAKKE